MQSIFIKATNLCCNLLMTTNTLTNQQTNWTFNIFCNLNCKINYIIYLIASIIYKIKYVGKTETIFKWRFDNHRKNTKQSNSILACKHFRQQGHNFSKDTKLIIIYKLASTHDSQEKLRELLVVRENFRIKNLKALIPFGLWI